MTDRDSGTPPEPNDSDVETETQAESEMEPPAEAGERRAETARFFVAGIGASAGGLEALGELVKHVPLDRMAFIVVQHLAPTTRAP